MTISLGNGVQMVTRAEWGARPPRSTTHLNPVYGTTAHWEGPHMGTFPHTSCAAKVRGIQAFHMDDPNRRWADIAYTALVCPHGWVFQGRWIGVRTAANGTNTGNASAYAVCYLSGEGDAYTDPAKRAMRQTMDYLDHFGGAGSGRNCHRDWKQTACPGDAICTWVRAGQPVPGTPPAPHPTPPPPTPPVQEDQKVIYLVQASTGGPMYFTDWLTKRVVVQEDVDVAWFLSVQHGHPIQTNVVAGKPTGKPIPLGPTQVDVLTRLPNA